MNPGTHMAEEGLRPLPLTQEFFMKVRADRFPDIITAWADKELIPKSSPVQIMMIVFAIGQFKNRLIAYASYAADEAGMIDLEEARTNALTALEKAGGKITIPVLNYNVDRDDLNSVFETAKGFAG